MGVSLSFLYNLIHHFKSIYFILTSFILFLDSQWQSMIFTSKKMSLLIYPFRMKYVFSTTFLMLYDLSMMMTKGEGRGGGGLGNAESLSKTSFIHVNLTRNNKSMRKCCKRYSFKCSTHTHTHSALEI